MCVIFRIYSEPSSNMNKDMVSLQKTNNCLLENISKVLGNDEADVNNQMSRKYKEENIRSYLKRFSSVVMYHTPGHSCPGGVVHYYYALLALLNAYLWLGWTVLCWTS